MRSLKSVHIITATDRTCHLHDNWANSTSAEEDHVKVDLVFLLFACENLSKKWVFVPKEKKINDTYIIIIIKKHHYKQLTASLIRIVKVDIIVSITVLVYVHHDNTQRLNPQHETRGNKWTLACDCVLQLIYRDLEIIHHSCFRGSGDCSNMHWEKKQGNTLSRLAVALEINYKQWHI